MVVVIPPAVACFAEGTLIATPNGDVAVEDLRDGDMLCTTSGEAIRLNRLMWRYVKISSMVDYTHLLPIRIKTGAIAENVPNRDLRVSGEHALYLDGVLIPAAKLINGGTVVREDVDEVTYYHLECARHAILLANRAATESYLDTGNDAFFANAQGATALRPPLPDRDIRKGLAAPWCEAASVSRVRAALQARAEEMGYRTVTGGDAVKAALTPRRVA